MHIYPLCPALLQSFRKFCWAVSEELRWQTVLSSIFHFGQISKFKKGVIRRKKKWTKFPVDMHICTLCHSLLQSFRKFYWAVSEELRWQTVLSTGSIFHFGQISKFKKGLFRRKKNWIKISCGHAHLHIMSFITTTFHEILSSSFRGVALTRKTGLTDWMTDILTNRSKTLYPPQLVGWGIIFNITRA